MRKTITTLTALSLLAAASLVTPADAVQIPTRVTTTCGTCVAPITCTVEDQCVLDFVGNNGKGYWRARQWNGTTEVRLTLVNGG